MKQVPLSRGLVAIVDDEDFDLVSQFKWYAWVRSKGRGIYAIRMEYRPGAEKKLISMHRVILGAAAGTVVDHIDGDGLNNRKSNLRICTVSQNGANRMAQESLLGFKGIRKNTRDKWEAYIGSGSVGGRRHIGVFSSAEDAAHAYDAEARIRYGQFARLNFPLPGEYSCLRKVA